MTKFSSDHDLATVARRVVVETIGERLDGSPSPVQARQEGCSCMISSAFWTIGPRRVIFKQLPEELFMLKRSSVGAALYGYLAVTFSATANPGEPVGELIAPAKQ